MSKPDLIELSTDWDTALRVADRYTGLGGEGALDWSGESAVSEGRDAGDGQICG